METRSSALSTFYGICVIINNFSSTLLLEEMMCFTFSPVPVAEGTEHEVGGEPAYGTHSLVHKQS